MEKNGLLKVSTLFALIALGHFGIEKKQTQVTEPHEIMTGSVSDPYAIIFDLSGILLKENKSAFIEKLGYGNVTRFTLQNWKNPGTATLEMLEKMSTDKNHTPPITAKMNGHTLPKCIVEWQQGSKACSDVKKEINAYIAQLEQENYFSSTHAKEITQQIVDLFFDPHYLPELTEPVRPMIRLVKNLKEKGYKLYILSNLPADMFEQIKKHHKKVVSLFDAVHISGETKLIKPDQKAFKHFLKTNNVSPDQCILVDAQKENLAVAEKLGITGILYKKPTMLAKKLKKLGVAI